MPRVSHSVLFKVITVVCCAILISGCSKSESGNTLSEYEGLMQYKIVLYNPDSNTITDTTYRQVISVIKDRNDGIQISFDGRVHAYTINPENIYSEQFSSGSGRIFRFTKDSLYFNEGVSYGGVSSWRQTVEWNFSGKKK